MFLDRESAAVHVHTSPHPKYSSEACLVSRTCRILKGRYTEQQAAHLVREVLQTVAQCHAKNVLMRDIKPENVSSTFLVWFWPKYDLVVQVLRKCHDAAIQIRMVLVL